MISSVLMDYYGFEPLKGYDSFFSINVLAS